MLQWAIQRSAISFFPRFLCPAGFVALNCDSVKDYVAARPQLAKHVGPASSAATWTGALCAVLCHAVLCCVVL